MVRKYKQGDRVRVLWRPEIRMRHFYGKRFLQELEKEQIIERVCEAPIDCKQYFYFRGDLRRTRFFPDDVEFISSSPSVVKPIATNNSTLGLPEI